MIELGQLERRHEDFARRNTRVLVVSVEGIDDSTKTQADFPHLDISIEFLAPYRAWSARAGLRMYEAARLATMAGKGRMEVVTDPGVGWVAPGN